MGIITKTEKTITEHCNKISISELKAFGVFKKPIQVNFKGISGNKKSFLIQFFNDSIPYLRFYYLKDNQPLTYYQINLKKIYSNLGTGFYYLFVCPGTGQAVNKLYLKPDSIYFKSRKASDLIYSIQTESPGYLKFYKSLNEGFTESQQIRFEKLSEKFRSKHSKKHYKGKLTNDYVNYLLMYKKLIRNKLSDYLYIKRESQKTLKR